MHLNLHLAQMPSWHSFLLPLRYSSLCIYFTINSVYTYAQPIPIPLSSRTQRTEDQTNEGPSLSMTKGQIKQNKNTESKEEGDRREKS